MSDERKLFGNVYYERRPELDKRIAHGDDYAGDAYVRWVAVGHHPHEANSHLPEPDFNQEVNLHADTIAERHDSQQGAQEGGSESIRQSVKKMNEQVAHDAKMFEDAHSAPPSAPASAAPEQRSAMPEPQRYNQMGSAMVACFDTFTGKPAGAWVEAKDYDNLAEQMEEEKRQTKIMLDSYADENQRLFDRAEQADQRAQELHANGERLKEAADGWKAEAERLRGIESALFNAEQRAGRMEKDAERYRWIRAHPGDYDMRIRRVMVQPGMTEKQIDDLHDAAIDAALAAEKEQK